MKKNVSPIFQLSSRLICVLMIVLIQLPSLALGFEFGRLNFPNQNFYSFNPEPANLLVPYSNSTPISITDRSSGPSAPNGISNPYPSQINVTGAVGTVTNVTVTLTGVSLPRIRDINIVVVAPTGQTLMLMSDTGQQDAANAVSNTNITFSDAAATAVPFGNGAAGTIPNNSSVTYRPTDVNDSSTTINDDFPAPGPASINRPAPFGTSTFASVFNGLNPNGNWSLYAIDDGLGGGVSNITGGWTIDITTAGAATPTNTAVISNLNPANTGQTITFTSTTTLSTTNAPVTTGTVTFTNNGVNIAGCVNVAVNGSGQATCSTTSPQGTRTIVATYSGTPTLGPSSGSLTQIVNSPTVVSANQFCNNGGLSLPDLGAADVYPANITVSGLVGTINKVTTQVNGLTATRPNHLDLLLVGSTNQAFQFMSDAGDATTAVSNINLSLDDAAASALPNGTALTGGTFRPSDYSGGVGETDPYPAPAPASFNRPAPSGAATFASVYNGTNPNGTWSIYAVDDGLGGGTGTIGGLCVTFLLNKFNTTTTLTTSQNPINQGDSVTFTATVTAPSSGGLIPSGSVQFFNGATSLGIFPLNGSGQASVTVSTFTTGNYNISAQYLGANVGAGGGGYNASTSNTIVQVVNIPTASNAFVEGRVLTASGNGVPGAVVRMIDQSGTVRTATTSMFGYYRFEDVQVGVTYVMTASGKGRTFNTRVISVNEDITDQDFVEETPK